MFDLYYRNRRLLVLTVALIIVAGLSAYQSLPRLEDPELISRNAVVYTRFPGANAERVEALVTEKIEEELFDVEEIQKLESTSRAGISIIEVELHDEVIDADPVWSRIRDKLNDAQPVLPAGVVEPELDDLDIRGYALITALTWQQQDRAWQQDDKVSYAILRRLAEGLEDRLRGIPGTEKVELFGEPDEEITVEIDPSRMASMGLSAGDVARQIRRSDSKVSAGLMRNDATGDVLIEVEGELESLDRIRRTPINFGRDGQFVLLGDFATITKGIKRPASDLALVAGSPAVAIGAFVQSDYRVDHWAAQAHETLDQYREQLPSGIGLEVVFNQSRYTEQRLSSLLENLGIAALAVVVVLFFMMGWRSAVIVSLSLPLASLMVLAGMQFLGIAMHQMSVTGLIIALGLLIDNAIVMVDEVHERLHGGATASESITHSVRHLVIPLTGSTLTTALAFAPIALLPGSVGEFVGTIAISVILALFSSLFLAMTVIPALTGLMSSESSVVAGSPNRALAGSPNRVVAGSPNRALAWSPNRVVAGSPDRVVAGSPDRVVARSPDRVVARSPDPATPTTEGLPYRERPAVSGNGGAGRPAPSSAPGSTGIWHKGFSSPRLTAIYRWALDRIFARPMLGMALAMSLPIGGFLSATQLIEQFFPPTGRDMFQIELELPTYASLPQTRSAALQARQVMLADRQVRDVHWFMGKSAPSFYYNLIRDQDNAAYYAQGIVQLESSEDTVQLIRKLQNQLDEVFPEARVLVRQLEQGPPFDAPIELRLYGANVDQLTELGDQARAILATVPDVVHTDADLTETLPKLNVVIDEEKARLAGLDNTAIAGQLDDTLEGALGGSLIEATEELPVRVRMANSGRADLARISSLDLLPVAPASGAQRKYIPVSALGHVQLVPERAVIARRNGRRVNVVRGYLTAGVLPGKVLADFRQQLDSGRLNLPAHYEMEFGGEYAERNEALSNLSASLGLLVVLMAATLVLSFGSFRQAGIIAVVGGLSGGLGLGSLWLFGYPFGFMAIVGTMGLIGVAINDSIVVLAALREDEGARSGDRLAVRDVTIRSTRHVLATTFTTIAGFLPLILGGGGFWPPLAITIAGGVGGATLLALVFVPSSYLLAVSARQTVEQTEPRVVARSPERAVAWSPDHATHSTAGLLNDGRPTIRETGGVGRPVPGSTPQLATA